MADEILGDRSDYNSLGIYLFKIKYENIYKKTINIITKPISIQIVRYVIQTLSSKMELE